MPSGYNVANNFEDIKSQLKCIKLMCCNNSKSGDISADASGQKYRRNDSASSSSDNSHILVVLGGSRGFVTVGTVGVRKLVDNDIVDTSVLTQESHSLKRAAVFQQAQELPGAAAFEEVVYVDMDITKPYHVAEEQDAKISAAVASAKLSSMKAVSPTPKSPVRSNSPNPSGPSSPFSPYGSCANSDIGSAESRERCYHSIHSTIISIATDPERMIFVTGDDEGGLGLWKVVPHEKHSIRTRNSADSCTYTSMDSISESVLPVTAKLTCFVNVNTLVSVNGSNSSEGDEVVNNIQFLPNGLNIVVSTTRRFLLVGISPALEAQPPPPPTAGEHTPNQSKYSPKKTSKETRGEVQNSLVHYLLEHNVWDTPIFLTWTVLDRSAPSVISMFSLSLEQYYAPSPDDPTVAKLESRITVWKLLGGDENVSTVGNSKRTTLYRFRWTDDMLELATQRSQPIFLPGESNITFL